VVKMMQSQAHCKAQSKGVLAAAIYVSLSLALCGCTSFSIHQTYDEIEGLRTTEMRGWTLFSGAQTLTKIKTSNTEKTQGLGVDAMEQRETNDVVGAVIRLLESVRSIR